MAWPAAARAGTTPTFTLLHQDAVAIVTSKGTAHFTFTLSTSPVGSTSLARVTIYPRVIDRSQLAPIVTDTGTKQKSLGTTSTFRDAQPRLGGVAHRHRVCTFPVRRFIATGSIPFASK
jgi:hypothetical protein